MFYVVCGTNYAKARGRLDALLGAFRTKRPEAEYFTLSSEDFSRERIEELLGSQGLFERKLIVLFDRVLENKEHEAALLESLSLLSEHDHAFLMFETMISAPLREKIEAKATSLEIFDLPPKKEGGNFALADAFGKKDRKNLWLLYRKAIDGGSAPEELHGILWWQAKSMVLSRDSKGAQEAGLKPFVYNKSKAYAKNFSSDELDATLSRLFTLYHESRQGTVKMGNALERFILEM